MTRIILVSRKQISYRVGGDFQELDDEQIFKGRRFAKNFTLVVIFCDAVLCWQIYNLQKFSAYEE